MTLYRSRPTLVEAVRWTGDNERELDRFAPGKTGRDPETGEMQLLAGKDGAQEWVPVPVGHWLVHPPADLSDVWPVEHEWFTDKYEEVGP